MVGGDYITTESGTGLVHTAPGHGQEDYQAGWGSGLGWVGLGWLHVQVLCVWVVVLTAPGHGQQDSRRVFEIQTRLGDGLGWVGLACVGRWGYPSSLDRSASQLYGLLPCCHLCTT